MCGREVRPGDLFPTIRLAHRPELPLACSAMARVLLIDDELTMVQMVTEMLRQEGHEVFPYTNLRDALPGLEAHTPEIVITDLYLDKSRAHGLEILQKDRSITPPATVT